jgi:hypothetical protein
LVPGAAGAQPHPHYMSNLYNSTPQGGGSGFFGEAEGVHEPVTPAMAHRNRGAMGMTGSSGYNSPTGPQYAADLRRGAAPQATSRRGGGDSGSPPPSAQEDRNAASPAAPPERTPSHHNAPNHAGPTVETTSPNGASMQEPGGVNAALLAIATIQQQVSHARQLLDRHAELLQQRIMGGTGACVWVC